VPSLLSLLAGVDLKRVTIITLSAGICILYAYVHEQNVQLANAKLVYGNPAHTVKIVRRTETGPVRIVTRYIERPSGEKETITEETRAPVVETQTTAEETKPVPLSVALASPRTDRFLVTLGLNRLTADVDGKALFVGYSIKNRVDIQAGGIEHDGWSPWILATARF